MRAHGLATVCEEASCPNIGSCWEQRHATFMIMGDTCTRACAFCNVRTGLPGPLDPSEPERIAAAVAELGLTHVVVTSVDRDDLDDGGAGHFAAVVAALRARSPGTSIELLIPDFLNKAGALETVLAAVPTCSITTSKPCRGYISGSGPGARYYHSLRLLERAKKIAPDVFTKSGLMLGLGETRDEVMQVMDDLRTAGVDMLTLGQYLQPTRQHAEVRRFVPPDEFDGLRQVALAKGFLAVASSPLTRSSHHAGEEFRRLQAARRQSQTLRSEPRGVPLPTFATRRFVPFTPNQMFDVVADVERYPEFLPLCESLAVLSREMRGRRYEARCNHGRRLQGHSSEPSRLRYLLKPLRAGDLVTYLDGPFHHLENRWRFLAAPGGSEIDFYIDYEFRSPMLALLMGALFDQAFRRFSRLRRTGAVGLWGIAGRYNSRCYSRLSMPETLAWGRSCGRAGHPISQA